MRKNKQLAMYFKKQSGHKTIRQYVNKEILNSCNLGAPGQLTVQNNISNDKLFNISTVLPLGFVIPTCWFSCPPLAGGPKSAISRRGNSKAGGGAVVPEGFVELFTLHPPKSRLYSRRSPHNHRYYRGGCRDDTANPCQ